VSNLDQEIAMRPLQQFQKKIQLSGIKDDFPFYRGGHKTPPGLASRDPQRD
jgi:hypothetical protein